MKLRSGVSRCSVCAGEAALVIAVYLWLPGAGVSAADRIGSVTMMTGAPRMVGQSIVPLQPILSGSLLETGENDGVGLLVEDIVLHIGVKSKVTLHEEPGRVFVDLEAGFVVVYMDAMSRREVVVETPFGRLTSMTIAAAVDSGWYAVRHDPAEPNVRPVSTFSTIEGQAEAVGITPVAGPHTLLSNQRWRIVEGVVPGPPEEGRDDAVEALQNMLYRRTSALAHEGIGDKTLTRLERSAVGAHAVIVPERTGIIDINDTAQAPVITVMEEPQGHEFDNPRVFTPGSPLTAQAQFIGFEGTSANQNWNDFLASVDGNPAFRPLYIEEFVNGGFSYIQFAGADAELVPHVGEVFLVGERDAQGGWALFTAEQAVADGNFADTNSSLRNVVTAGFRAIAEGEHLAGDGAIGGDGADPGSAFAVVQDGDTQFNPDLPVGYPLLDQAAQTTGLTVDGVLLSDQIAALGSGQNPQQLGEPADQLVFLSDSGFDASGNRTNFDGEPIRPTELNLPGDRTVDIDQRSGAPSTGIPLSADSDNTVGIQFAPQGEVIAIIHHTGLRNLGDVQLPTSEHFEVVRGERYSIVQWREGGRINIDAGLLEAQDLNSNPEVRNELFELVCAEINNLTPIGNHTVCGPAKAEPDSAIRLTLRRRPGLLVRLGSTLGHRELQVRRGFQGRTRSLKGSPGTLKSAGGRLLRPGGATAMRRHIGRRGVGR